MVADHFVLVLRFVPVGKISPHCCPSLTNEYDPDSHSAPPLLPFWKQQGQMINEMEYQAVNAPQAQFMAGRQYGAIS